MFPPGLEEYVTEANPVGGIDAYVESLDLHSYGFQNTVPVGASCFGAGQPAYPPQALLKLYLYGYLNRVRSSRRLEKETHRNVEVIWLVEGLRPSDKTIADFRKDNAKALRRVNKDQGRDTRDQFEFDAENNLYRCPAGQYLERQGNAYDKRGRKMIRYAGKSSICGTCPDKEDCLTEKAKYRQIVRWEHEMILEKHRQRMDENGPEMMRKRSGLAEHPFGTLKRRMGWDHFLVRGFRKVRGEMSLMVLGYNFTRALNIIGLQALRDHCAQNPRQWQENVEFATSN